MEDTTYIEQPEQELQQDPPLKKLYDVVSREKLYTKSFDEFKQKYSTPEAINKMYDVVSSHQLYTKSKEDFNSQYFSDVKKKGQTVLPPTSKPVAEPLGNGLSTTPTSKIDLNPFDSFGQQPKPVNADLVPQGIKNPAIEEPKVLIAKPKKQGFQGGGFEVINKDKKKGFLPTLPDESVFSESRDKKPIVKLPEEVEADYQKHKKNVDEAITLTTIKSLKNRGINVSENSPIFYQEEQKIRDKVKNGDLTFSISPQGEKGFRPNKGILESFTSGVNAAAQALDEAQAFRNWTDEQRVDYVHEKAAEQQKQDNVYFPSRSNGLLGGAAEVVGENIKFIGKAASGTAAAALAAPTLGLSEVGAGALGGYIATSDESYAHGAKDEVLRTFEILKQQNPTANEVDLMAQARKREMIGGAAGAATNALLMRTGEGAMNVAKKALSENGKKAIGETIKNLGQNAAKSAVHMANVSTGIEALKTAEGALEGIKEKPSETYKRLVDTYTGSLTTGGLLAGVMQLAGALPKAIKSSFKTELVKNNTPQEIEQTLRFNEEQGNIPQGSTEKTLAELAEHKAALDKTPPSLSPEAETSYAGLVEKKTNLQNEMATKDENSQGIYKPQIEAIDKQLKEIAETNKPVEFDEVTGDKITQETQGTYGIDKETIGVTQKGEPENITKPIELSIETNTPTKEGERNTIPKPTETEIIAETKPTETLPKAEEGQIVAFENAKEGDIVVIGGQKAEVVGRKKSRGGADVVEVKSAKRTKEEIRAAAVQNVINKKLKEYNGRKVTMEQFEIDFAPEIRDEIEHQTALENSRTATYTIDAEQWNNEVKTESQPKEQPLAVEAPTKTETPIQEVVKYQIESFGVPKEDIEATHNLLGKVFDGLKKAGLTAAKTVGDWVGIGKGKENPYSLKIDGKDVQVKNVQPEVVNGFYSPLEKTINETKADKLPAKQWADKFRGEEAKWTGLKDWLNQQQGSVSKTDIQNYLKDNRIEIVEVVKGGEQKVHFNIKAEKGKSVVYKNGVKDKEFDTYDKADDYVTNYKESEVDATKFSKYQLEGQKENYKEVLVTLPNNSKYQNELNRLSKKYNAEANYKSLRESKATDSELEILRNLNTKGEKFKSSHFDEPNILVHLRMNTRTDSEGNKVLFLEEVQSDWGQKGKKEGFKDSEPTFKVEKVYGGIRLYADGKLIDQSTNDRFKSLFNGDEKYYIESFRDAVKNMKERDAVPNAPFVTDTNAWTKLGLKVALKEAVKQGADKIAWTTGEQQNERYDLSKQVDKINYKKNENGTYDIVAVKGSESVFNQYNVKENELEGIVGKEVANKIVNSEGEKPTGAKIYTELKGNDLKVGGKGMKGFYGSPTEGSLGIVGNVAKSLYKQEPKTVKIRVDGYKNGTEYVDVNGDVVNPNINSKYSIQHSIDITPELKASVESGQPLFKDAEAQYRIESGKNIIEAIKDFNQSKNKARATVALTHEIMHPTVVSIIDGAKKGNEVGTKHTETIVSEFNKANPKNKVTVDELIKGNDNFKGGKTSEQYRAVQEFIAKSWEKYHTEGGKGFSEAFQKILDQITQAFKAVYKSISGKEITPELRKMFDEILGKEVVNAPKEALRDVESTTKALQVVGEQKSVPNKYFELSDYIEDEIAFDNNFDKKISEAYHKAKLDGTNPELVKAVEELLGNKNEKVNAPKEEVKVEEPIPDIPKSIKDKIATFKAKKEGGSKAPLLEDKAEISKELPIEEKQSLVKIKSKVIEKSEESQKSAKKEGVSLKVQKDDLIGKIKEAMDIAMGENKEEYNAIDKKERESTPAYEKRIQSDATNRLKEAGFDIENEKVVFDIEGDGVFKLGINSLDIALSEVEKHWGRKIPERNDLGRSPKLRSIGKYDTIENAEQSKQDALDNLETAKKSGNKKQIELYEAQAKLESDKYKEAFSEYKANKEQIKELEKRIKEDKIESVYHLNDLFKLPELKNKVAEFEGKVLPNEKPNYQLAKDILTKSLAEEQSNRDELQKSIYKSNGQVKLNSWKTQGEISNLEKRINSIKEKINEVDKGLLGKEVDTTKFHISEPTDAEVSEVKDIVKDLVKEGHNSLETIQNIVGKEMEDSSAELRTLVEKAFNEYGKEKENTPKSVTKGVIGQVGKWIKKVVGNDKDVTVLKNTKDLLKEADKPSDKPIQYSMKMPDGKILGFTRDGHIYLNGEHLNPNTPIHEAGHIWTEVVKEVNKPLYKKGIELVNTDKGKVYLEAVKNNKLYQEQAAKLPESEREAYYQHEALATAIGDNGAKFVTEARKAAFKEWLNNLWISVKKAAGFKDISANELSKLTFDEYTQKAARDILNNEEIQKEIKDGNITEQQAVEFNANNEPQQSEPTVKSIESKAESENETELNEAIKEADDFIESQSKQKSETEGKGNATSGGIDGIEPPKVEMALGESEGSDWTHINKKEISDAADLANTHPFGESESWKNSVNKGLKKLAKIANKGESLYDAAKNKVNEWAAKVKQEILDDGKSTFNPSDEEIAQMAYHRTMTNKRIAELEPDLTSPIQAVRDAAEIVLSDLEAQKEMVDYVLHNTATTAGRAFNIRQMVSRIDAENGLQIKRMDIIRKQKGQPLSEKQEQEIRDIHDEEAKNAKAKDEYTQKKSQQDFEEAVKAEVDRRMKEKGNKSKPTGNAKKAGDIIRKLKMPKGDARLDITLGGWDVLVEGVAKLVEGGITVAEAVKKMIDEGEIAFKTDKDKAYAIDYIDNAGKHNAIDGIKELAENEKSEMLTKSAVGKGLVNDLVNHYIDKGIKGKELFNEINKDIKEIFPEITEQQVRDAYLKEGEFTLDKKENINKAKVDAKNELRSIAKNETDIADLKAERDLRKREREERQKTDYENKLIAEKKGLIDKKALTEKQEARLVELNKELERIKQRKEKEAKVSNPKDLNRSDKEKAVLDEIKKEKEDWAKEKQAQRDLEVAAKKAQTAATNEANRLKALTEKRNRLEKGQRDAPKTSTPKVESPAIETVKAEIKEADKKLREAESEANRLSKEIQAKKDKLAEHEANIKRAENGLESIKTNRRKSDAKIDTDIADAEKRLQKELNKQGLKLEKGSKAEKEQKQKVADSHNERAHKVIESIDTKLQDATLTANEKAALENAKKILEKSKINPGSKLDIFDAVEKAEKNTELARAELANSDKLADIKHEISRSQIQMGKDKLQTEQDILLQRHKDSLQKKIDENERRLEAGEYVEKEPARLKTSDAESVKLEIKDRETRNKLNAVGKAAQRAAMTKREKVIDTIQSLYVIGLVGRLSTLAKVGVSALTKQPLNTITSQTFGRLGGVLFPKIENALRGEGNEGWRKEKNRYMAHYGALGKEGMAKLINKGKVNAQKADEAYINAKDKLEDIGNQHGTDSKQYKDFKNGEFKKAESAQKQALLDNVTNSIYEWIGGNSWADAAEVFLHSSAKLEQLLGKGEKEMWADKTRKEKIMFVLSTSAATHGVLKNFSARAEFAASFVARLENKMKQGVDISSPEEILKTVNESYIAFQRGKYQEDNAITGGFKAGLEGLQRWAERHPDYKYAADLMAGVMKFKNPIVRTPINIAREAIVEYTMGVPLAISKYRGVLKDAKVDAKSFDLAGQEMKDHMRKFMDNLDADKADFIYRAFRKGGFGLGVMALTAMGGIKFGGFFNKDEKKKNEDNGLGINEVEIGGVKLSHLESKIFMHTSAFFPSLLWSNYDRVRNENLKSGDGEVVANLDAAKKDIQGMIDQIPIGNEMQNPLQGIQIPLIGPFLSEYAEATDVDAEGEKIKRKPKGNPFERLLQNVEMKFPKLRQNVPISGGNAITTSDKTMLPVLENGKKVYDNGKEVMRNITKEQSEMWDSKAKEVFDKKMENPDEVIYKTINKDGVEKEKIIKFGEGNKVNETGEIDFKIESQNINWVSSTDITKLLKYNELNEVQKKELNSYIKKLSITEAKNKLFGTDDNPVDPLTEKE